MLSDPKAFVTVGNHDEAETAALIMTYAINVGTPYIPQWKFNIDLNGWSVLGVGGSRTALLSPTGTVYKIAHGNYEREQRKEWESYFRIISPRPYEWRPAELTLWPTELCDVIAMEYVPNPVDDDTEYVMWEVFAFLSTNNGIYDMWEGNVGVADDGTLVLIDYSR